MQPLDDIEKIRSLDSQDHFDMAASLPAQLQEAYEAGADIVDAAGGEVGGIAVAGMGGSAIGSDLIANVYDGSLPSPLVTVRGYDLPHWIDSRSLVFIVSYSGNTEESLSCLGQALERGCRTICISSGGSVAELAASESLPLIRIPSGMQPRAAMGYLSIPIAACLESLGLVESLKEDLLEAVTVLEELGRSLAPEVTMDANPAKQLALKLEERVPVIYGCELTDVAARRWKCQINENAKTIAFANEFPELNHNEIVGWQYPADLLKRFKVVYLVDRDLHPQNSRRMDITASLLADCTGEVIEAATRGESRLARLFSIIHMGDYVSLYLAIINGEDPSPVDRIEDLKRRLA